jgi:predicted secreted protein
VLLSIADIEQFLIIFWGCVLWGILPVPVKLLEEKESPVTKLLLKQILTYQYALMSISNYATATVMGGTYYTMKKAREIVQTCDMGDEGKESVLGTLALVRDRKGIQNARLLFRDDRKAMIEFNDDLHALVELGINPATIPEEYGVDELPNPIPDLYQRCGNLVEEGLQIEIEDDLDTIPPKGKLKF